MNATEVATKYAVPILTNDSDFPEFFAVHSIVTRQTISGNLLLAPDNEDNYNLTSAIDNYLGTDGYVFFSLGKGYLSTQKGWGLIYDPFELVASDGANIVKNDLLYVLDQSSIIPDFCLVNKRKISSILESDNLVENVSIIEQENLLWGAIDRRQSLLVVDPADDDHYLAGMIFDALIRRLPEVLANQLGERIRAEITIPNTITSNLHSSIRSIFVEKKLLLNAFSDQTEIEDMPEIRIPNSHPIGRGLIAVYDSKQSD